VSTSSTFPSVHAFPIVQPALWHTFIPSTIFLLTKSLYYGSRKRRNAYIYSASIPPFSRYPPRISYTLSIGIDAARLGPKNFRQTSTQMYPYIGCTCSAPEATSYPLSSRFSEHFVSRQRTSVPKRSGEAWDGGDLPKVNCNTGSQF
jgi:hypothetical protein